MGPTAAGKTALAVQMVQRLPCEIVSVDSAMVYRGMDIGTAKPSAALLEVAPHRLIDFLDPAEYYSVGQFCQDVLREIDEIVAKGRIPLLVGGTMMYFRALQQGLANLPARDLTLRAQFQEKVERYGVTALHDDLSLADPIAAQRIHSHDRQRIFRALEVFLKTGKMLSALQSQETTPFSKYTIRNIIISPNDRALLHARIEHRLKEMFACGLVDEVKRLFERGDLTPSMPSMRAVGYRQIWEYLSAGEIGYEDMYQKALAATRQLAKRQITWLRSMEYDLWCDSEDEGVMEKVVSVISSL
ncbi:MAG: tRNA (adenosine(37)-N6)-dimethylallyltransferase MiaA [Gammaproteobacteria bacterium RIFCSPHIGHO2_12_FULL_42_10]|nr:MAG: tRNA (adenosine(37)-N6)-dimethylallyltransferase MiaA [Gammaproteobacteria bacterium RIFCSPHIGHO2_12_FULL_42_10]